MSIDKGLFSHNIGICIVHLLSTVEHVILLYNNKKWTGQYDQIWAEVELKLFEYIKQAKLKEFIINT